MGSLAEKNYQPTKTGVSAICCICDARSRPVKPDADGEPTLWNLPPNWTEAPYPHDFRHDDGSVGSQWTCPKCFRRLRAGEALRLRNGRAITSTNA